MHNFFAENNFLNVPNLTHIWMAYNNVLHLALSTKSFTVFKASILKFEITKPIQYLIYSTGLKEWKRVNDLQYMYIYRCSWSWLILTLPDQSCMVTKLETAYQCIHCIYISVHYFTCNSFVSLYFTLYIINSPKHASTLIDNFVQNFFRTILRHTHPKGKWKLLN